MKYLAQDCLEDRLWVQSDIRTKPRLAGGATRAPSAAEPRADA
jgi:hypothetical protein